MLETDSCVFCVQRRPAQNGTDSTIRVYCDCRQIGELLEGQQLTFDIQPGVHTLSFLSDDYVGAHSDITIPETANKGGCIISVSDKKPRIVILRQFCDGDQPTKKKAAVGGDKPVIICRKHWTLYLLPSLVLLLLIAMDIYTLDLKHVPEGSEYMRFVLIGMTILLGLFLFLHYTFNYIMLSESHITARKGIIRSKTFSTPLNKVQNVGVENGLLGKIFGFHTLIVDNAGVSRGKYVFKHCANAARFAAEVQKRI